ncbi:MAG: TatD family deoxyribonuclease, partial [Treponema sp.]
MLSDTHCHLSHISERGVDLSKLLSDMRSSSFSFVLDIGTKPGDFVPRLNR